MATSDVLLRLAETRERLVAEGSAMLATAADEARDLSDEEVSELEGKKEEIGKIEKRLEVLEAQKAEEDKAAEARAKYADPLPIRKSEIVPGRPEPIYRPDGPQFFRDLWAAKSGDLGAIQRLDRHNKIEAHMRPEYRGFAGGFEERAGTTGSTSIGAFIPPAWLLDEVALKARAGRTVAGMVRSGGAPTSNSMQIPRITTGSSTAIQASENANLSSTDVVTANITLSTSTIGGIQDVSIQSLELGTYPVDRLIFGDLSADYQRALDAQLIIGTGASGQLTGLDTVTGINAVTYTDASPTQAKVYSQMANANQQVFTNRFAPADAVLMHPRRWGWFEAGTDTTGRPLVPFGAPYNPLGLNPQNAAQGAVGQMLGLPVYTSANVPTTISTNQDEIYVCNFNDMILFEGPLRAEVFRDVGSQPATVRFRVYAFVNFFAGRFPGGISQIRGTGLVAPTF